jgi:hypothetical protein
MPRQGTGQVLSWRMIKRRPESEQLCRAARHLMQTHGAQAAAVAIKRAAYLYQSGETVTADKWRRIAALVRDLEAEEAESTAKDAPAKETTRH